MESWCFDPLNTGFVSNETISATDSVTRNRSELMGMGCELKPPFSCEDSLLVPSGQFVENSCFSEVARVGIAEFVRKQDPHDSIRSVLNDNASVGGFCSPSLVTSNVISGDDGSSSKFSSSIKDSSSRESSLVDMKLGGFGDKLSSVPIGTAGVLSSDESSAPPKRAKVTSLSSRTAYCQVYGCNKDLSSAKDYHKRHKVCDVHSKTPIVIVNGIEQRFCQQCSRFHLLGEFDDGKRSCRKRLAGHNERRRKPQVGFSSRCGRSFQPYTGSNLQGFTPTSTSFICQDIILRGNAHAGHAEKNGTHDWVKHIKVEDGTGCDQKPAYNCINGQLQPKYILPPYFIEKQFPFIDHTNNTGPQITLGENVYQYSPDLGSHTLFHTNSLRNENLSLLDTASTVKGLPGISESGCALSLLSSQSRSSSGYSSAMPGGDPLLIPSSTSQYSVSEVSEKLFGVGEKALSSEVKDRYPLIRITSTGRNQPSSKSVLINSATTHSEFGNEIHHNSKFMNTKDHLLCEDGTTIDLLQLSSQMRVENQRLSELLKQKNQRFLLSKNDRRDKA